MVNSRFYSIVLPFVALLFVTPLLTSCSQHTHQGAGTGALTDDDNTWRGAVNGGAPGADFGGTIAEISDKAAGEAIEEGRPVRYESGAKYGRIEASPGEYNEETKCHKVRERAWEDDKLVKDEVREICKSSKTENVY